MQVCVGIDVLHDCGTVRMLSGLVGPEYKQALLRFRIPNAIRVHQRQTAEIVCLRLAIGHAQLDQIKACRYKQMFVGNVLSGGLIKQDEIVDRVERSVQTRIEYFDFFKQTRCWLGSVCEDRVCDQVFEYGVVLGGYEKNLDVVLVFGEHVVDGQFKYALVWDDQKRALVHGLHTQMFKLKFMLIVKVGRGWHWCFALYKTINELFL